MELLNVFYLVENRTEMPYKFLSVLFVDREGIFYNTLKEYSSFVQFQSPFQYKGKYLLQLFFGKMNATNKQHFHGNGTFSIS